MNKTSYYLVIFIGMLTVLSFFPHAFLGMQAVIDHIQKGEIVAPAADGMRKIWLYSSIMMLVSGLWLLLISKQILLGSHTARLQVLILGIGLVAFGLGCTYISKKIDAMFAFTIQGVVLIIATSITYKRAHHIHDDQYTYGNKKDNYM